LWPYLRLRDRRGYVTDLSHVGSWLVDPDSRILHSEVIGLMLESIREERDSARGLHAAALVEPSDREPIEHAARGRETLGRALAGYCRWFPILNSACELSAHRVGDRTEIRYAVVRGEPEPPAFADSVLANLLHFARRYVELDSSRVELRLTQARPAYAAEYDALGVGTIRFDAEHNSIVLPNDQLVKPLPPQSATLTRAYEFRAEGLLRRVLPGAELRDRLRDLLHDHLKSGAVTMQWAADQFRISVPTLRRRLREEGTTFSSVMDEVRSELATRKLNEGHATLSEIAHALGFAHASAFKRAFRRWTAER
jgi:AraC-like DNA-binding protein